MVNKNKIENIYREKKIYNKNQTKYKKKKLQFCVSKEIRKFLQLNKNIQK